MKIFCGFVSVRKIHPEGTIQRKGEFAWKNIEICSGKTDNELSFFFLFFVGGGGRGR